MTAHARYAATTGLLLTLAVLAGCAGGSSPSVPSTPAPQASWASQGPTTPALSLLSEGAVCDGHTDDRPALRRAVARAAAMGGAQVTVPAGRTCVVQAPSDGETITLPDNVSLRGGSGSALRLVDGPGRPTTGLLTIAGSNVWIEGLTLEASTRAPATLVVVARTNAFAMTGSALRSVGGDTSEHQGIRFTGASGNVAANVEISATSFSGLAYGLFLSNTDTVVVRGLRLQRCRFSRNSADDIELNAPAAQLSNVVIQESSFLDNTYASQAAQAGFAVGVARASEVTVSHNSFSGYAMSPVHVEDRSRAIHITENSFAGSATHSEAAGVVTILSGSRQVSITSNTFDLRRSNTGVPAILVTAGSSQAPDPADILVAHNSYVLGAQAQAVVDATAGAVTRESEQVTRSS